MVMVIMLVLLLRFNRYIVECKVETANALTIKQMEI